jgi:hypothetical protein
MGWIGNCPEKHGFAPEPARIYSTGNPSGGCASRSLVRCAGQRNEPSRRAGAAAPYAGGRLSQVTITDSFWQPKQQKIATVTLDACIKQTEVRTGRIRNFENAARRSVRTGAWA